MRLVKGRDDSEQVVGSVAARRGIIGQAVTDSDMETFHVPIRRLPDLRSVGVTVGDVIARAHRHPQTQADSA